MALEGKPAVPFRVPTGLKLVRIDPRTGMRAGGGEGRQILEAYKPSTSPPDYYTGIGGPTEGDGRSFGVTPDADRMIRSGGTGGLY